VRTGCRDAAPGGSLDLESVREGFYHDCPEPLARRAFSVLRHQSFAAFTEECPIDRWPDVPSTYVLMREDRAVGELCDALVDAAVRCR
jgi:hypothetical protein